MMRRIIFPVCFIIFLFTAAATGQTILRDCNRDKAITLEVLKTNFGDSGASFFTSASFLSVHLPVGKQTYFVGELPFSYASFDFESAFIDNSGSTIGNPYLGIEYHGNGDSRFVGELGVRLPLTSDESIATITGLLTNSVDRLEAFAPKVVSLHGLVNYLHQTPGGFSLRLRGGPIFWYNTDDNEDEDKTELSLLYGFLVGYNGQAARIHGGFNGRFVATEDGDFGENSLHEIVAAANFGSGSIRPGLSLRLPLDENFEEGLDYTIGLDVAFQLK